MGREQTEIALKNGVDFPKNTIELLAAKMLDRPIGLDAKKLKETIDVLQENKVDLSQTSTVFESIEKGLIRHKKEIEVEYRHLSSDREISKQEKDEKIQKIKTRSEKKIEIFKCFFEFVDINKKDDRGWTLLHRAALKQDLDTVKILLECKASPLIEDNNQNTPIRLLKQSQVFADYYLKEMKEIVLINNNSKKDYAQKKSNLTNTLKTEVSPELILILEDAILKHSIPEALKLKTSKYI